jgi:hypothetical protein
MRLYAIVPLALCVVGLSATARGQVPAKLPPAVTTDTIRNAVTVQNARNEAVTVYLEKGVLDRRIGIVPAFEMKTLPLPDWAVSGGGRVRLFAHLETAGAALATEEFKLVPSARIGMIIASRNAAPRGTTPEPMTATIPPEELANATLTVDNVRTVPVTVFAEQGQSSVRLGEVPADARMTLRFPKALVSSSAPVTVFVRPLGGLDLGTHSFTVREGAHMGLRVPAM